MRKSHIRFIRANSNNTCFKKGHTINLGKKRAPQFKRQCPICQKVFYVPTCLQRIKYCSLRCLYKSRKGQFVGPKSPTWKGGKVNMGGYIYIKSLDHPYKSKSGYIAEHRLIIEKLISRYLLPHDRTHHLNEIKDDNRPENLMAFTSESAHQRFHKDPNNVKPSEIIFDGRKLQQTFTP